jgi:hypothetical protein
MSIESVVELTKDVCSRAEVAIDRSLNNEKALSVVDLSTEIAETVGIKQPMCYQIITLYINERPNIYVKMGKGGGIRSIPEGYAKINGEVVKCNEKEEEKAV